MPEQKEERFRIERDPVGEVEVPAAALDGVQTKRALDNFQISPLRVHGSLITAFAEEREKEG